MAYNYLNNLRVILHLLPRPKNNNTVNSLSIAPRIILEEIIGKGEDERGKDRKRKKAGQED